MKQEEIDLDNAFCIIDRIFNKLNVEDWAKGDMRNNKIESNEIYSFLVITDHAKKRIAKEMLREGYLK